ncbi:MAG: N-acetyl-gamma-glutamyl-phosphate reductase [Eubacterium sp.]|nr:N-acetyl-gamma-glutamyl-phosphate reductase [Eubacterium sp.]
MKHSIFIDGAHGTTGLKIREYLAGRDDIEIIDIEEEKRKDLAERARLAEIADVAVLCLPDAASKELADAVTDKARLIDTSTAHRVADGWTYGLPELTFDQRRAIAQAKKVANPGCHATGLIVLTRPLVDTGVIAPDYPVTSFCVTGYSGGGKAMIARHESEERDGFLGSPGQYALGQAHKHLPEMVRYGGLSSEPSFCPVVGDFYSGMVMTIPLRRELMNKHFGVEGLREVFAERYEEEPLIHVRWDLPDDGFIHGDIMAGRDDLEIFVGGNDERPLVIARFDNLGKGASGAAVQNLNIMLGTDENKGLRYGV